MDSGNFAERLNFALKARNITASELSKRSGASEGLISGYRKGFYKAKQERLDRFAQILDVSIPWLMGYDVPMGYYDGSLTAGNYISISNIAPPPKTYKVPRLGTIACGEPILAEENIETEDEVPENIRCDFTLKCRGDSMTGARINDGDLVYIRTQPDVENGEIAAVLIDEAADISEATLKRLYKHPGQVVLQAENPKYPAMVFVGEDINRIRILGLAVGFTSLDI